MNVHSEARLSEVMPDLAQRVRQMAEMLEVENIAIEVTQGLRTFAQQNSLYAIGRTLPGKEVTNAEGGYSWHCMGMACDVAPFDDGIPDWNNQHPAWARIVAVGESLGLVSGISWRDEPHFQMSGIPVDCPTDEDRALYLSEGIEAVWKKYLPNV